MSTKISTLKKGNKFSYGIKVKTEKETFVIPVVDVRDGEKERAISKSIIKAQNQSKFTKPSYSVMGHSYHVSRKKD